MLFAAGFLLFFDGSVQKAERFVGVNVGKIPKRTHVLNVIH